MNNIYEERLGTDKMLPLIFRMAMPAIAAQFVNLLYSIIDRIYIGHIPDIGTNAFGWYRSYQFSYNTYIIIFCNCWSRRFASGSNNCIRSGRQKKGRKDSWQRVYPTDTFYHSHIAHHLYIYEADSFIHRSIGKYH